MLIGSIEGVVMTPLEYHHDKRGWLSELFRRDELPGDLVPVMAYISETRPGMSRGPHEHREQTDLFCFFGPGDLTLHLWDARPQSRTFGFHLKQLVGGSNPCRVIVPPGVVHGYKNTSEQPAWVFNAPDRLFAGENRSEPVDEIRHENEPGSLYRFD